MKTKVRNRDHDGWDSYPLYLTTQLQGMSLINTKCPKNTCKIIGSTAKPYDPIQSTFYKTVDPEIR